MGRLAPAQLNVYVKSRKHYVTTVMTVYFERLMSATSVDPKPISVKITPEGRRKIRLAAYLTEMTISSFVRAAAERAAERAIQQAAARTPAAGALPATSLATGTVPPPKAA